MMCSEKERFFQKITKTSCWTWVGAYLNKDNPKLKYGIFRLGAGKNVYAHRYSYELAKGPIPKGYCIDHLCKNPSCVNPDHLEAVTLAENVARGESGKRSHCFYGHAMSGDNVGATKRGRYCRACNRRRNTENRKK